MTPTHQTWDHHVKVSHSKKLSPFFLTAISLFITFINLFMIISLPRPSDATQSQVVIVLPVIAIAPKFLNFYRKWHGVSGTIMRSCQVTHSQATCEITHLQPLHCVCRIWHTHKISAAIGYENDTENEEKSCLHRRRQHWSGTRSCSGFVCVWNWLIFKFATMNNIYKYNQKRALWHIHRSSMYSVVLSMLYSSSIHATSTSQYDGIHHTRRGWNASGEDESKEKEEEKKTWSKKIAQKTRTRRKKCLETNDTHIYS